MPHSVIVLSEVALAPTDALTALEYLGLDPADREEPIHVRAVVPADTERSLIAEVIDKLGMADLQGVWDAVSQRARARRSEHSATLDAHGVLASVQDVFTRVGCEVEGTISPDDPIDTIRGLLDDCETQTVVVYSDPQLLEETFAQDWAHRVEDALDATVLHLYPGSPVIGTS